MQQYTGVALYPFNLPNLDRFYQMVSDITLEDNEQLNSDREFFRRFSRCNGIVYSENPSPADFDEHLEVLANLKIVLLLSAFDHLPNDNKLLNSLGEKCSQLETLMFESWEKVDFGFLSKLQRLKALKIRLAFPPPPCTLVDFLKNHRDLVDFEVSFIRSNNESQTELSELKKRVNETFSERFKARKLEFRVEIYTKVDQFVRYRLHEAHMPIGMDGWSKINETMMFRLIKHKRAWLGKKAFKKFFG